jgi:small subunit ribosomal protein S18
MTTTEMADNEHNQHDESEERGPESSGGGPHGRMGPRRRSYNLRIGKTPVELYKDVELLRRYLTERGRIRPRRQTGLCARDQRRLAVAVKRARHLALLPFTAEHARGD